MTARPPMVSVVMAAYNGAAFIAETLDSLAAQDFADFEVIFADDCSTDDTAALVRAYGDRRVRLVRTDRNGGPVHARNLAFSHARGRYVAGLDQDDLCDPRRLSVQVAFLDANPGIVLVGCNAHQLVAGEMRPWSRPTGLSPDLIDWMMLTRNPLIWSSVMFRRDAACRLVPFERPERLFVEDFDLYYRIRAFGGIAQIDAPLVLYRCHAGGASQRFARTMRANSVALLEERHAALLGKGDAAMAALVVRHLMAGEPVRDVATLRELFGFIDALRGAFLAARPDVQHDGIRAIDDDIARLWWKVARAAVRSGAIPMGHALDARRAAPMHDRLMSRLVGQVRAMRNARA